MNITIIFKYMSKSHLLSSVLIILSVIDNYYSLNRTKRTIGIFRRPDKLEAIRDFLSLKEGSNSRTRFYLYSRRNSDNSQELTIGNEELLRESAFNPNLPIKFVINGWLDNRYFAKWVRTGINALLLHGDYNVIYVGWKSIQELFVAAILIKFFGEDLAQFIIFIKNTYGISGDSIHCIGHSLGAFLCGFAGAITYIGRLTALDAGPRAWFESMAEKDRINRWQAGFVDVIHSDFHPKLSWGLTIPVGDIDFYPNESPQPGCFRDKLVQGVKELRDEGIVVGVYQWVRYMYFCSHYRSHEWFFESVSNRKCTFVGVRCPSYHMFRNGECDCESAPDSCVAMGYDSDTPFNRQILKRSESGKWFIKTSDFVKETGSHCLFQYTIRVNLGQLFSKTNGTVTLTFITENEVTQEEVIPPNGILHSDLEFGKLMVRQNKLKQIQRLLFSWSPKGVNSLSKGSKWISVKNIRIRGLQIPNKTRSMSIRFCTNRSYISAGVSLRLEPCDYNK